MEQREVTARLGMVASVPLSLLSLGLFFMPWLGLRCDTEEAAESLCAMNVPELQAASADAGFIGQASAWELARGEFAFSRPYRDSSSRLDREGLPSARPWMFIGLLLPPIAAIAGAGGALGGLGVRAAGKAMLVVALAGVALTTLASTTDFADDVRDAIERGTGGGAASLRAGNARDGVGRFLKTQPTAFLWTSMGVYGVLAACGLFAMTSAQQAEGAVGASDGPGEVSALPAAGPPPRDRRAGNTLPAFGPNVDPVGLPGGAGAPPACNPAGLAPLPGVDELLAKTR